VRQHLAPHAPLPQYSGTSEDDPFVIRGKRGDRIEWH